MSSPFGSLDVPAELAERGIDFAALGTAYLVFLATAVVTIGAFYAARNLLVISPNRGSRDYGIYVSSLLAAFSVAIVLENEFLPPGSATLHYVFVPQMAALLSLHAFVVRRQEPWLVALAGSASAATVLVGTLLGLVTDLLVPAYWIALLVLTGLLAFLWLKAVSTQRAFVKASSIYLRSKETTDIATGPQTPWLGLPHWVALIAASVALGVANSLLRGRGLEEIPAVEVAVESGLLLLVTGFVSGVPAAGYWLARKAWMPELTRFVWLAWMVVGFALTYGNYLTRLQRA